MLQSTLQSLYNVYCGFGEIPSNITTFEQIIELSNKTREDAVERFHQAGQKLRDEYEQRILDAIIDNNAG